MNYEIREIANYIIAQPKLPYCKVVIHSWLIHSSIYCLQLFQMSQLAAWHLVFRSSTTSTCQLGYKPISNWSENHTSAIKFQFFLKQQDCTSNLQVQSKNLLKCVKCRGRSRSWQGEGHKQAKLQVVGESMLSCYLLDHSLVLLFRPLQMAVKSSVKRV